MLAKKFAREKISKNQERTVPGHGLINPGISEGLLCGDLYGGGRIEDMTEKTGLADLLALVSWEGPGLS